MHLGANMFDIPIPYSDSSDIAEVFTDIFTLIKDTINLFSVFMLQAPYKYLFLTFFVAISSFLIIHILRLLKGAAN